MTVDTDLLASITLQHLPQPSPFAVHQSLPDAFLASPGIPFDTPHTAGFHPATFFNDFRFGNDNPEPPIDISSGSLPDQRSRSRSATRNGGGKATPAKARSGRKMSMNDARPPTSGSLNRGRSAHSNRPGLSTHHRTMSHSDAGYGRHGLGVILDTHKEGQKTDSISPPEYGSNSAYGSVAYGRLEEGSWGSMPSLIPGSIGSFANEEAVLGR
jgi:hypothetical protein